MRNTQSLAIVACLLLGGCASAPEIDTSLTVNSASVDLSDQRKVYSVLLEQADVWQGTPYRYGGMGRSGVDCSGLVYSIFLSQFGHAVPRTTKGQARLGNEITQDVLRSGDLVFFKTGHKSRHVGIYLQDNRFLHASESKGVIVSRLDNPYWQSHYWMSRRL